MSTLRLDPKDPRLERNVIGQMQRAEVVFLDEVFNASSAILNALLTFMNERKFHDRGVVYPTPLKMLFGATNHAPREEGLGAVYDRFLLRCRMENAPAGHDALSRLLSAAWTETHSHADAGQGHFKDLPGTLQTYRDTIETMTTEGKLVVDPLGKALPQLAAMKGRDFYAVGGTWRALARIHIIQSGYPLKVMHGTSPASGATGTKLAPSYSTWS